MAMKKTAGSAVVASEPGVPVGGASGAGHPDTADPTAPSRGKGSRAKSDYLILRRITEAEVIAREDKDPDAVYWTEVAGGDGMPETFDDTVEAVRHIRDNKVLGNLRVVAVKKDLTVEEVPTTTLKIS